MLPEHDHFSIEVPGLVAARSAAWHRPLTPKFLTRRLHEEGMNSYTRSGVVIPLDGEGHRRTVLAQKALRSFRRPRFAEIELVGSSQGGYAGDFNDEEFANPNVYVIPESHPTMLFGYEDGRTERAFSELERAGVGDLVLVLRGLEEAIRRRMR